MSVTDILIIVMVVLAILFYVFYRISSKNMKKAMEAEEFVNANKQVASIYVIDKKYDKPTEKDLNKQIYEQLNSQAKRRKLGMVKAKVGPQILTLICDKNVYEVISVKKTIKVELSGLYIVSVVGINLQDKKKKTWKEKLSLFTKSDAKKEAEKIVKK